MPPCQGDLVDVTLGFRNSVTLQVQDIPQNKAYHGSGRYTYKLRLDLLTANWGAAKIDRQGCEN